ncbi:hypothetical protein [Saccharopolyspora sp. CA-218241]|uniref:hypothetical protein n=1 Tax=Saccharopolyspora sp. CA-218241 TaxID=3240027 RepID=UPI003D992BF2
MGGTIATWAALVAAGGASALTAGDCLPPEPERVEPRAPAEESAVAEDLTR